MAQKKYYAVKSGRNKGIFDNWQECKNQIQCYSGAIYKSFSSYEDAYKFLNGEVKDTVINEKNIKKVEAYVDGSYYQEYNRYSYGCVILYENKIIKFGGVGNDKEYVTMRNVAGELLGAMKSIEWAYENKYGLITIYHDYEGIERWANGIWKANKKGTKEYVEFIKKYREHLEIRFKKVKAHSGNFYNEEADKLAKQALFCEIKEFKDAKKDLDRRIEIFNNIMNTEDTTKNSIHFLFKNYIISESKLKKFVKEVWGLEGNDKNKIDIINLNVDVKNSKIEWNIKDLQGKTYFFEINI
ncbi:viroplasmin family protein [Anaerophilus nitritogenes]|uniref:ribonuclease H1 domain-containing protein n=1 Tax=Anaerophilus nitritogenes TaxID=2498136 RepID=UPI00101BB24B|nr:ribonuclease H family protein [Anaerophilus nitritogenes]